MMKKRRVLVWIVAGVTFGSGLVNLFSLIRPGLSLRAGWFVEIFPLEFLHLSAFLTLLIGFALVISSINIYKRKKRAFQSVFLLACLSIIFHLTQGLDYEDVLSSMVLLILLVLVRKSFTVKSSIPDLRLELIRLGIAVTVAISYGMAGFWFLDEKEFHINFTLRNSIYETFLFLSLVGDPQVVPHTRYAHWFVNSLYMMTMTTVGYCIFVLFRPVLYQFRTHPQERAMATEIVLKWGRSALDYFKLWPDKSYFFSPSQRCFLAYRVGGNFAVVLGDPVGPEEEIEDTIRTFMEFCQENDWGLGFHQTLPDFLPIYQKLGFKKLKIGDSAIVDLKRFSLQGKAMKKIRHYTNQLEKSGIQALYYKPPIPEEILLQVKEVSDEWLQVPGRRERGFTLGRFEPNYIRSTPLFVAIDQNGQILAFANIVPSYCKGEATIDLMRHRRGVPNGIMDYLFVKLFLYNQEKGYQRFDLGMAPMSGFQENEQASREEKAIHYFFQHLNFLFSYIGLRQYKAKFVSFWEPRYVVYRNPFDLPRLAIALSKVSELKRGYFTSSGFTFSLNPLARGL
ncbi:MAG TPA: phosphatidylglycerol lysyltransferase domain-containing protein [Candidatus Limnocylindrales bacterium]|nr:phosphatidylglycerol lysyltransferase domain-containing protein [Candidatus Limnocylindrales bacterium]